MSELISTEDALAQIAKIENEIRKGGVIVLPIPGSYIYLVDAFNPVAVKKMHQLRGAEEGVAASVVIGKAATLNGIAKSNSEIVSLANKFWPGPLTILVEPNPALSWNLGDDGELGEFAVQIPNSELLLTLANNIGPLAFASAAAAGKGAAKSLDDVSALIEEIAIYVDNGSIPTSEKTTVVRSKDIGSKGVEIVRIGAISLGQIQEIIPEISLAELG